MCVYVGGVVDVVECGLFFKSRCVLNVVCFLSLGVCVT